MTQVQAEDHLSREIQPRDSPVAKAQHGHLVDVETLGAVGLDPALHNSVLRISFDGSESDEILQRVADAFQKALDTAGAR